ncbi:uncharacterized protein AB675_9765 [Cyphellophora attinorum]|uniref:FAD/NAD(P)-binding domain-containing protein n=1 Tax=Cyphellophora attinorum TaxID=1664694 RepID=A0A0N1H7M2_9EURO|nr:uncharacterized protein AB675_9765 [Phialophora attinorum]KPI42564.1 hypothetical protein AB675_9765 [Phialophora attinorum]
MARLTTRSSTRDPSSPDRPASRPTTARCIVIGAGFGGLAAAKTYLQLQPHLSSLHKSTPAATATAQHANDLLILDALSSVGGVWSRDRLYPGLVCQGANGLFEFSDPDISQVDEAAGFKRFGSLPATRVMEYMEGYAAKHGLLDRFRGGVRVVRAERRSTGKVVGNEGWRLHTSTGDVYDCEKLLVCVGSYNVPHLPLPKAQQEGYEGLSIHSRDMGRRYEELIAAPPPLAASEKSRAADDEQVTTKHILVVGGNKSALEACGLFLRTNRQKYCDEHNIKVPKVHYKVTWLVHPSPRGVHFMILNIADEKGSAEPALSRAFAAFNPSVYDTYSGVYRFMHSSRWWAWGSILVSVFWWAFALGVSYAADFGRSENVRRLRPGWAWTLGHKTWGEWWKGGGNEEEDLGIEWDVGNAVQMEPSHEILRVLHGEKGQGVDTEMEMTTVRGRVKELRGKEAVVVDKGGKEKIISADSVIWCTGWLPSGNFFDEEEARRVGAPLPNDEGSSKASKSPDTIKTLGMQTRAQQQLLAQFPRLRHSPYNTLSFNDLTISARTANVSPAVAAATLPEEQQIATQQTKTVNTTTHYNLLRHNASPWCLAHNDHSIAFVGMTATTQTAIVAELSALWSVAWCEGLLEVDRLLAPMNMDHINNHDRNANITSSSDPAELEAKLDWQTALQNNFMHLRWGSRLSRDSDVILEVQTYMDRMCVDLGLRVDRKRLAMEEELAAAAMGGSGKGANGGEGGKEVLGRALTFGESWTAWKREWLQGYTSADYRGMVDEFVAMKLKQ